MAYKKVRSYADLAIRGAEPTFEPPLHVGRPNVGDISKFFKITQNTFDDLWLTNNGPNVRALEKQISDYLQVEHVIAVSNATSGLEILMKALEIEGEVILPSYTFVATAHAVQWCGAKPIFADIELDTHCLCPKSVESLITENTTTILGVHLWGNPANTAELQALADKYNLRLLFDSAHAFGCKQGDQFIGNFGTAEVFSFHATKFFNTFEGGAITTNDAKLAEKLRLMRNFGFQGLDNAVCVGINAKMSEIHAAMGLVNFEELSTIVGRNQHNFTNYSQAIKDIPEINILTPDANNQSNYQYIVFELCASAKIGRDEIIEALCAEGILARRYFWPGCHNMLPYRDMYPNASMNLPNTQQVADRVIVLPTGTTLPDEAPKIVSDILRVLLH